MSQMPRYLAIATSMLLVFAACGGDETQEDNGDRDPGNVTLEVAAQDFQFSPSELSADPGAEVTIEVTNEGGAPHTFTAPAVDVDISLDPGASDSATFTAPDSGSVEWSCTIHPQMTGVLSLGGDASGGGGSSDKKDGDAQEGGRGGYDY